MTNPTPNQLWELACQRLHPPGVAGQPHGPYGWQASSHKITALCLLAIALAGCSGLPDQRLANEALKRGDIATAQQNYQVLADLGYTEAQVGLADIWMQSRDAGQLKKAEATYRAAAKTSPRAKARLGRLLAAKPGASEAELHEAQTLLKQAFASGDASSLTPLAMLYLQQPQSFPEVNPQQQISQWLAAGYPQAGLAQIALYRIQDTYDQHLDQVESICKQALASNDSCYVELATVYQKQGKTEQQAHLLKQLQIAYSRGTASAQRVDGVARVLTAFGTPDPDTAKSLLENIAPVYPASWVSLAQLLYDFPEQGDVAQLQEYLDNGRAADQPRAELLLGKLYYDGKWLTPDAAKAEAHFLQAVDKEVAADYYLGQIYRRGYLGQVYPQKALDHLLKAARNGQNSADFAIAQLFSQGKGTRPNLLNAYVFSQLAKVQDTPQGNELAAQLDEQLPVEQRAQARRLLQKEQALRASLSQNALAVQSLEQENGEEAL